MFDGDARVDDLFVRPSHDQVDLVINVHVHDETLLPTLSVAVYAVASEQVARLCCA